MDLHEQVEYEQACQMLRFQARMRLSVLAFISTVNGSVITICSQRLRALELGDAALSAVTFLLSAVGVLFDYRLVNQMKWYHRRLCRLESRYEMELFTHSYDNHDVPRRHLTGALMMRLFYCAILLFWIVIWIFNLAS